MVPQEGSTRTRRATTCCATRTHATRHRTERRSSRCDKCLARLIDSAYIGGVGRIDPALLAEFEAAARRPLAVRWRYSFIRTYKPVLDDAEYRSFDTMEEYRQWCERELPDWLGYGRVRVPAS